MPNAMIGNCGIHHVALRVKDFDASMKFYTEVLGMAPRITWGEGDRRAAMLDCGDGSHIELFAGGDVDMRPAAGMVHFALRTDDVDAAVERVRAAGMEVTNEPKDVTIDGKPHPAPVRLAFFRGPNGEVVEFMDMQA